MDRKVTPKDHPFIKRVCQDSLNKIKGSGSKAWLKLIDDKTAIDFILSYENAYIVGDAYLVLYDIFTPWYAAEGTLALNEVLVLKLLKEGNFSCVPEFLERKAREAGAAITGAGTALAPNDAALASLYEKHGYTASTIVLTKEL